VPSASEYKIELTKVDACRGQRARQRLSKEIKKGVAITANGRVATQGK